MGAGERDVKEIEQALLEKRDVTDLDKIKYSYIRAVDRYIGAEPPEKKGDPQKIAELQKIIRDVFKHFPKRDLKHAMIEDSDRFYNPVNATYPNITVLDAARTVAIIEVIEKATGRMAAELEKRRLGLTLEQAGEVLPVLELNCAYRAHGLNLDTARQYARADAYIIAAKVPNILAKLDMIKKLSPVGKAMLDSKPDPSAGPLR